MFFIEMNDTQCKSYLIADMEAGKAAIIDPVNSNVDRYLALLAYHELKLEFVADTHTHADHRSACTILAALTGAKVCMHEISPQPKVDMRVVDGDVLNVGDIEIKVLHTPGHTPDSISFVVNGDRVLTGDVILVQGTGRSDFAGGDAGQQYDSIINKVFSLADDTLIFPGHDYRGNKQSTVAIERETNPRVADKTREEYIELMANLNLPLPERIQEVLQINQSEIADNSVKFPLIAELNEILQLDPELVLQKMELSEPPVLIDVREQEEFTGEFGHIKGSQLIPLPELTSSLGLIDSYRDKEIILICRSGARSTTAAAILKGMGFANVENLKGGMLAWNKKSFPVENKKSPS